MASFGLLLALSGYTFDIGNGTISFEPKINKKNFSTFFINAYGWGIYHQKIKNGKKVAYIETLYGDFSKLKVKE
jgi:hypothetical protein